MDSHRSKRTHKFVYDYEAEGACMMKEDTITNGFPFKKMSPMQINCSAYEIVMVVHELHQQGYEQLRLFPGMSPNGCAWRWRVYPKIMMGRDNRFEMHDDHTPFNCIFGSTGEAFPKENRRLLTVDEFMEGNQDFIGLLAKAKDAAYVEWYAQIVEHAKAKDFPIAFADGGMGDQWQFLSGEVLPYPPFTPTRIDELPNDEAIRYARSLNLLSF